MIMGGYISEAYFIKKNGTSKKTACTVIVLALALTLFFCFPKMALAGDKLIIPEWVVDAHLLETGDLQIVEDITFEFNDKFNGVFRDIVLERISGVSDIRVQEISGTDAREYMLVDDAEKGDHDVFIIKEEKDRIIIQIFSPSKESGKTFRISYVVEDVAVNIMILESCTTNLSEMKTKHQ